MGGPAIRVFEQLDKVKFGKTGLIRYEAQVNGFRKAGIYKQLCLHETAI